MGHKRKDRTISFDYTSSCLLTVHSHDSELVSVTRLQALHYYRVLVELVLSLEPGGILQFPEND